MNNKVIVTIDVSRPSGCKIVREQQNKRAVTLEYSLPEGKNYCKAPLTALKHYENLFTSI